MKTVFLTVIALLGLLSLSACADPFADSCTARGNGAFVKSSDQVGITTGGNIALTTIRYCVVPSKGIVDIE